VREAEEPHSQRDQRKQHDRRYDQLDRPRADPPPRLADEIARVVR